MVPSFGGIAPLLTMLNSCAAGVTVVNIDNGFGAAVAAARILHALAIAARAALPPLQTIPVRLRAVRCCSRTRLVVSSPASAPLLPWQVDASCVAKRENRELRSARIERSSSSSAIRDAALRRRDGAPARRRAGRSR